jgi:predicted enzyme related to lactoylglutathione lyase
MAVLRAENYLRARAFYEDVLGFTVDDAPDERQGIVHGGMGTRALIYERPGMPAPQNTTLGLIVDDIEGAMGNLRARGVVFEEYESPELGIVTKNGIAETEQGRSAWFKDSEGNYLVLTEFA